MTCDRRITVVTGPAIWRDREDASAVLVLMPMKL